MSGVLLGAGTGVGTGAMVRGEGTGRSTGGVYPVVETTFTEIGASL